MNAVDLFAGVGGFGVAAEQAGIRVVWAANHWRAACHAYAANHGITPECQDLRQANFVELPRHDILLASPCCQGHSKGRGKDQPHHDAARATAWAVVDCMEANREALGVIENVPEFLDWVLYPAWKAALEALGYSVSPHIVDAADHGVAQNRVRVFVILTRSRSPLVLDLPKRAPVSAGSIIDWQAEGWHPTRRKCAATRRRVAAGRARFGERFVCPYYGNGSGLTGRSLDRPIGTLTTRDRWLVVDGRLSRILNVEECRAFMGFPAGYRLPADRKLAKHLLGNAVCPPPVTDILNCLKQAA